MNKSVKKMLITGVSLLLFAGVGIGFSNMSNNKAHADVASSQLAFNLDHSPNQYTRNYWINYYNKYWYQINHPNYNNLWKAYVKQNGGSEPESFKHQVDNERPLSEIYPNGHWNGESDIKESQISRNERKQKQAFERYYNRLKASYASRIRAKKRALAKKENYYRNKLNRIINRIQQEELARQRYSRRWYRSHTYKAHNRVRYLSYRNVNQGFSKSQWRYAFPQGANGITKLGLTKSYKAVMKSAKGPDNPVIKYKSDAVVKPGQLVQMKLIRRVGKYAYVYRAKFRGHYYYYTNDCDKWESEITPFTADYYKGDFQSVYKPWTYKVLYLNSNHKLHNGSEWDYNPGNSNDTYYKLKNGHWHETNYSYTAPTNLDE